MEKGRIGQGWTAEETTKAALLNTLYESYRKYTKDEDPVVFIEKAVLFYEQMTPEELRQTNLEVYGEFSKKRFAKRIDQNREASKPYGANPMQAAAKKNVKEMKKLKNRPDISRLTTEGVCAYVNE